MSVVPQFAVLGVAHATCPAAIREQCARAVENKGVFLKKLCELDGVEEALLLSTCNRFEILITLSAETTSGNCAVDASNGSAGALSGVIDEFVSQVGPKVTDHLFVHTGRDAIEYFFRVTASLESMVVGEVQITAQVKDAYKVAVESGTVGKFLHRLCQSALKVSKKVRANTGIAQKGVSVSYIAVKLAEQIFGNLKEVSVLLIGSGKMAELSALHLKAYGCESITVANRTISRAEELAARVGGIGVGLPEIAHWLPRVDVVIGSILIDKPLVEIRQVRQLRRNRPLFFIDLGIPRNFPSQLAEIDGVYLYDVDDLGTIADENRRLREEAAADAGVIVDYGVFRFELWLDRVAKQPVTLGLREHVEKICTAELTRVLKDLPEERTLQESVVQRVASRIAERITFEAGSKVSRSEDSILNEDDPLSELRVLSKAALL